MLPFLCVCMEKWPKTWKMTIDIFLLQEISVSEFNAGDAISAAMLILSVHLISAYIMSQKMKS